MAMRKIKSNHIYEGNQKFTVYAQERYRLRKGLGSPDPQQRNSMVAGYKVNTQKSVAFLYRNNEQSKREIKKTIAFTEICKKDT